MTQAERYEVVAAFPDDAHADGAVRKLADAGVRDAQVHVLHPGRDDGFVTPDQAKGAFFGTFVGVATGAGLGAIAGFVWITVTHSGVPNATRMAIAIVLFAVAGAVSGFIAGGALKPRIEGERVDPHAQLDEKHLAAEQGTVVALHLLDQRAVERAVSILEGSGAERVDAVRPDGTPIPPQAEHPRPADPPGRWSSPDAKG